MPRTAPALPLSRLFHMSPSLAAIPALLRTGARANDLREKPSAATWIAGGRRQSCHGALHRIVRQHFTNVDRGLPCTGFLRRRRKAGQDQNDNLHSVLRADTVKKAIRSAPRGIRGRKREDVGAPERLLRSKPEVRQGRNRSSQEASVRAIDWCSRNWAEPGESAAALSERIIKMRRSMPTRVGSPEQAIRDAAATDVRPRKSRTQRLTSRGCI